MPDTSHVQYMLYLNPANITATDYSTDSTLDQAPHFTDVR